MGRKIKFPLEMSDGIMVRTIEELRENFNLKKIIEYYLNGKLMTWLIDRNYKDEYNQINGIDIDSSDLGENICRIFKVKCIEGNLDIKKIQIMERKVSKLKEFTDNNDIINNAELAVFNQEELQDLLNKNPAVIYLVNGEFSLPLDIINKRFIGIGETTVIINSDKIVNFDKIGIIFENIKFNKEYYEVIKAEEEKNHSNRKKYKEYKVSSALKYMENNYDENVCRKYFDILQDGFLDVKFNIDIYGKSLRGILKNENLNEMFLNYKNNVLGGR